LQSCGYRGHPPRVGYWRLKYTEGPLDRAWMQEKDRNYLTMLAEKALALIPPSTASQPNDPTGLIATTRQLHRILAARIATYNFDTYERIEQQLLDAKARLPGIIAGATAMAATSAAAAAGSVDPAERQSVVMLYGQVQGLLDAVAANPSIDRTTITEIRTACGDLSTLDGATTSDLARIKTHLTA